MSDRFGNIPIGPTEPSPPAQKDSSPTPEKPAGPRRPRQKVADPATATAAGKPHRRRAAAGPRKGTKPAVVFLLILAACLVLYSAAGFIGVPYYLQKVVPKNLSAETGLLLETDEVTFNPFRFVLEISQSRISDRDGSHLLSLEKLEAKLAPLALLRNSLVCNSLTIKGLFASIVRDEDGFYNIARVFGRHSSVAPSEIIDFSDLPFYFSLNNIEVKDGTVRFLDAPAGKRHLIEQIQLKLPTFSNFPFQTSNYLQPHFSATINGSPVELSGQAHLGDGDEADQATQLAMELGDLDLANYVGYLPFKLPVEFTRGKATGNIALGFDPRADKGNQLSFTFALHLSELEVSGKAQALRLAAPEAQLSGSLLPVSRAIHLTGVALREPVLHSFGPSMLANINALRREGQAAKIPTAAALPPWSLAVDQLTIDQGQALVYPKLASDTPLSRWQAVQLTIKDYRPLEAKQENLGTFRCSAEKSGTATSFSWQGSFTGPQQLQGSFNLSRAASADLFRAAGAAEHFQTTGSAEINGQLDLQPAENEQGAMRFSLNDAEVVVQDFTLYHGKEVLLNTPLLKTASLSWNEQGIDFGTAQLKGATAQLGPALPAPLQQLSSSRYRLQGLDFDGRVVLTGAADKSRNLELTTLQLQAADNSLTINAGLEGGGRFKAEGEVALFPFALTLRTSFTSLPAAESLHLLSRSAAFADLVGELSGNGTLTLPEKSFSGAVQLTRVSQTGHKTGITGWEQALFENITYTAVPFQLGIARVEIVGAVGNYRLDSQGEDGIGQFTAFIQSNLEKSVEVAANKKKNSLSALQVQAVQVSGGKFSVVDNRLDPPWQGEVGEFSGQISALQSPPAKTASTFSFSGVLDDAPFTLEGKGDFFTPGASSDYRLILENLPLASYHRQLADSLDISTSSGEFQLELLAKRDNDLVTNTGLITLTGVTPLAENAASALPLALLTGADQRLPIEFDFSHPPPPTARPLFDELLKKFQGIVLKAAVSPLLLASGDYTDLIGNEFIEFRPGEFTLSDTGQATTARYSALLIAHPRVALEISAGVDPEVDGKAIAAQLRSLEEQRVEQENQRLREQWLEKREAYRAELRKQLEAAGKTGIVETDLPASLLEEFVPIQPVAVKVDNEMLLDLARKRQGILFQYFTSQLGVEPERVITQPLTAVEQAAAGPANGLQISLRAIGR